MGFSEVRLEWLAPSFIAARQTFVFIAFGH